MLTYEIHLILCDDIHYIDSQPFKVAKSTKFDICDQIIHQIIIWLMKNVNASESVQRTIDSYFVS